MASNAEKAKVLPPYISYVTFKSFVESLEQTLPTRIDHSIMKTFSGTQQSQMRLMLSYLGLTDNYGNITPAFEALVEARGDQRKLVLERLVRSSYTFLFDGSFDLSRATLAQLQDKFRQTGAQGETVRKGVTLFVNLAEASGIPLSHYITNQNQQRSNSTASKPSPTRQKKRTSRSQASQTTPSNNQAAGAPAGSALMNDPAMDRWREQLLEKFPPFDPSWNADVQSQWFVAFQRLMRLGAPRPASGGADDDEEATAYPKAA